ncbi:hypothetical protein HY58_18580 [Flavihumibacter sp. ZG627]|nr:hypothetical protein HY58_18580 [Flavihumibacter sp. ZG627]
MNQNECLWIGLWININSLLFRPEEFHTFILHSGNRLSFCIHDKSRHAVFLKTANILHSGKLKHNTFMKTTVMQHS